MQNIILFLVIIVHLGHNDKKQTTKSKSQIQVSQNSVQSDSIYRFTVSFISIGSGTDKKARKQFHQFIEQYNEKNNVKIYFEIIKWGREGEIDYCFKLSELKKQEQIKFITETKELLKTSLLIRYYENDVCIHKGNKKK